MSDKTNVNPLVTVFTPLYNREESIKNVYLSLVSQTCKDFEWLVINDGSTDASPSIMDDIISTHSADFRIGYYSKPNEGLNRTINKALDLAQGKVMMRLDSDDEALPDAVQLIKDNYNVISDNDNLCAVVFLPVDENGNRFGYHPFIEPTMCDFGTYRDKYSATGDRAEVMKLSVYRNYKYPEIDGEKFIPESVVWNRIAQDYKALYINEPIYKKGRPSDTITASIYSHLKRNCNGTLMYYKEIVNNTNFSYRYRILNSTKYYRYVFFSKEYKINEVPWYLALVGFPVGLMVILRDFILERKR